MWGYIFAAILGGMGLAAIVIYVAYLSVDKLKSETASRVIDAAEVTVNRILTSGKTKTVYLDAITSSGNVRKVEIKAESVASEITDGARYRLRG